MYYAQKVLNRLMGLVDDRAAAIADELNIEHIDLRPVLAPTLDNYYDFAHYTPAGAAIIARTIADVVLRGPGVRRRSPSPLAAVSD